MSDAEPSQLTNKDIMTQSDAPVEKFSSNLITEKHQDALPDYRDLFPGNRLLPSAVSLLERFNSGKDPDKKPRYNFVLQNHKGEKNAESAFEKAKNCDVICYEWSGVPLEEKELFTEYLNLNAQGILPEESQAEIIRWLQEEDPDDPHYLLIKFFNELRGSNKIFVLLDICKEDPIGEATEMAYEAADDELGETMYNGSSTLQILRDATLSSLRRDAAYIGHRDSVSTAQLAELDTYLDGHDLDVGVFEGIEHEEPSQNFERSNKVVTRSFIPTDPTPGVDVRQNISTNARQVIRAGQELLPSLIDRVLVEYYINWGGRAIDGFAQAKQNDHGFLARQLEEINDSQIQEGIEEVLTLIRDERQDENPSGLDVKVSRLLINKFGIQTSTRT